MINELVARVFNTRNEAHIQHWVIKSGYNHETLGALYEGLIAKIDPIVESYMAIFGDIDFDKKPASKKYTSIVDCIDDDLVWIHKNRNKIIRGIPAMDNMLQELEQVYITALFKLRTKE